MVIWIIGLSGSGKTTLANEVINGANLHSNNTVMIDGDVIRKVFGNDVGYSLSDRLINAKRICELCRFLDYQGINVVCSILSLFPEIQNWNRVNINNYYEVYIDSPIEDLIERDSKGIYGKYIRGEINQVIGMDIKFPVPKKANLVIKNNKSKKDLLKFSTQLISMLIRS